MARDPEELYRKVRARLAPDSGATDAERETSKIIMDRLRERYGQSLGASSASEEIGRSELLWTEAWEHDLLEHLGAFLGLQVHDLSQEDRRRHNMIFSGEQYLIDLLEELHPRQHRALNLALSAALFGYLNGAMPLPAEPGAPSRMRETEIEVPEYHARKPPRRSPPPGDVPQGVSDDVIGVIQSATRMGSGYRAETGRKRIVQQPLPPRKMPEEPPTPTDRDDPVPSPFWRRR